MRLTYILAVMVVATLHASTAALPSDKDPKAAVENGAVPGIVDSNHMKGGRLLRRVDNDYDDLDDDDLDDDDFEEERGFGDLAKKLNPVTAVKKSAKKAAEQSAKAKETLKEAVEFHNMMERAKELVYKNN